MLRMALKYIFLCLHLSLTDLINNLVSYSFFFFFFGAESVLLLLTYL